MTKVKRQKRSPIARLRPFWFLIVVVAIAAGLGGYYAATWPGFFPKRILISGNRAVSSQEIAAHAAIRSNSNIWLQNTGAAAARIETIPYIKTAGIRRSLPANVRIVVTERVPFAVLHIGPDAALVDRDLRVLERSDRGGTLVALRISSGKMPADGGFVKDPVAIHLRNDCTTLTTAHVLVRTLSYDKYGDLVATMLDGIRLLLGSDSDLEKKTALVGPILSQVAAGGRRIAAVDLRAPKTPVVVYR